MFFLGWYAKSRRETCISETMFHSYWRQVQTTNLLKWIIKLRIVCSALTTSSKSCSPSGASTAKTCFPPKTASWTLLMAPASSVADATSIVRLAHVDDSSLYEWMTDANLALVVWGWRIPVSNAQAKARSLTNTERLLQNSQYLAGRDLRPEHPRHNACCSWIELQIEPTRPWRPRELRKAQCGRRGGGMRGQCELAWCLIDRRKQFVLI